MRDPRVQVQESERVEITDEMVERAARELHQQHGHHPASWNGHHLTAAKAILHVALKAKDA